MALRNYLLHAALGEEIHGMGADRLQHGKARCAVLALGRLQQVLFHQRGHAVEDVKIGGTDGAVVHTASTAGKVKPPTNTANTWNSRCSTGSSRS